ncbi:MAG: hypothetical protein AMXMBFR72_20490 [Betaproteobacteria bacterium]|nr:MAG: hypothetical protein BroJett031_31220 [Betaproteobacteria bacterium]
MQIAASCTSAATPRNTASTRNWERNEPSAMAARPAIRPACRSGSAAPRRGCDKAPRDTVSSVDTADIELPFA